MAVQGAPVTIVESGGFPVKAVESNAPLLTIAGDGLGSPITISDLGAPFIVQGYSTIPPEEPFSVLSSDDGSNLVDDNEEIVETYSGQSTA